MRKTLFLALISVSIMVLLVGCRSSDFDAGHKARREVGQIFGMDEQDMKSEVQTIRKGTSESHQMMAIMILNGAKMDTDLDSYDEVFLVDVATKDGSNTGKVVVVEKDGVQTTVVPQALKDQKQ